MSSATTIAPEPIPQPRRGGLSSIKTMFGTKKRHTIAQVPTAQNTFAAASPLTPPEEDSPSSAVSPQAGVSSLFTSQKRSLEKAAEKERKEQAKQTFQLSTIDDQGIFHPPTPMEKSYREHFIDNDADYFDMIINTPPERVKTFLSAEKTISPYMFSAPRNAKNKRHTFSSFATQQPNWFTRSEFVAPSPSLPPTVPPKDFEVVQVTVAPQDSAALEEALSNSINSLLDSPDEDVSARDVPDLVEDSGSESPSPVTSTNVSPRSSTSSLTKEPTARQENVKRIREQLFGEELPIPF